MKDDRRVDNLWKGRAFLALLVFSEFVIILFAFSFFVNSVIGAIGQNVTVITRLDIGNVYPEIINVTINGGNASLDLVANSTVTLVVEAVVRDFNGATDLNASVSEFFDNVNAAYGDPDDFNNHYSNSSCFINRSYGSTYEALVTCLYEIQYNANNQTWNATFYINDSYGLSDFDSKSIRINKLIAIGLPSQIDYGTVNATNVSDEKIANVTNFGNTGINLSLEGYAVTEGDGWAMNCSLGVVQNISINYEKYNLTSTNTSILALSQFEGIYTNLTNESVIKQFGLNYRQEEGFNEATNETYWRIYVPIGVAGTCTGNIIFGATEAQGA
jgi:hypothetical protein